MTKNTENSPLRVLHVVTYMGRGGLETMIMNHYRNIDRKKVQFDFLVHRDFEADYDKEIYELGGRIFRLPKLVPWSPKYHNALNDFFKNHPEYDIVHVHQDCLSSIILKAAKKSGITSRIAHSHNSSQTKDLKYPIKLFYRPKISKFATHLFACGKAAGDWMFCGKPYDIIHNAIDAQKYIYSQDTRFKMRKELGIADNELVIGHVGRFLSVKNHTFLLDVFKNISEKHPSKLLLIGDGALRKEIESKAKSLNISKNVIFTGIRKDIAELLQAIDCFVFPSLYEGVPVSVIEAQAAGLPCYISDRISDECMITPFIKVISLNSSAEEWANIILSSYTEKRENALSYIVKAGYDITSNAKWLQNFYLKEAKEVQ